jgi:dUTP pyrophosphatase
LDTDSPTFPRVPLLNLRYSAEKKTIPSRGKANIDTKISIAVPPGTYGRVAPRSGLGEAVNYHQTLVFVTAHRDISAAKFSIDTGAGVIDADYRGVLFILLFNLGDQDFEGSCHDFYTDDFNLFTSFFLSLL